MTPLMMATLGLLMVATSFLSGLEAMSDAQFRTWANRLITTVAGYYILYGSWLMFARESAMAH